MKRDYTRECQSDKGKIVGCREHIICPVFVARDLSGLGWPLKEGHYDMGTGATGGETDAL